MFLWHHSFMQDAVMIRNPRKLDEVVFIPHDTKDVKPLTKSLLEFINSHIGKIDPIILAAIFHRQHVIIHPFMDGNGQATRLITTAILGKAGLDLFGIFSFEDYYNRNITQREYGEISERSLAVRKLDLDRLLKLALIEAKGTGHGTYYVLYH